MAFNYWMNLYSSKTLLDLHINWKDFNLGLVIQLLNIMQWISDDNEKDDVNKSKLLIGVYHHVINRTKMNLAIKYCKYKQLGNETAYYTWCIKKSAKLKIPQHFWIGWGSAGISTTKLFWKANFQVHQGCFLKLLQKWLVQKMVDFKCNLNT